MDKEQKQDKWREKSVKALQNFTLYVLFVQHFLELIVFLLHLHGCTLGVLFSFQPKILDIGNTPAVTLDRRSQVGHLVPRCKCLLLLLLLINRDGPNEEDEFPQGEVKHIS